MKSQNINIKKWDDNKLQNIRKKVEIHLHNNEKHSKKHNKYRKKKTSINASPTKRLLKSIKSNKKQKQNKKAI